MIAPAHHHVIAHASGTHWAAIVTGGFAGVAALGVIFAAVEVRRGKRARIAAASSELANRWDGERLEEARRLVAGFGSKEELAQAFMSAWENNHQSYYVFVRELNFFEDLGILAKLKALDFRLIEVTLGSVIVTRWEDWKPAIDQLRSKERDAGPQARPPEDSAYSKFEALAKRMAKKLGMTTPS